MIHIPYFGFKVKWRNIFSEFLIAFFWREIGIRSQNKPDLKAKKKYFRYFLLFDMRNYHPKAIFYVSCSGSSSTAIFLWAGSRDFVQQLNYIFPNFSSLCQALRQAERPDS